MKRWWICNHAINLFPRKQVKGSNSVDQVRPGISRTLTELLPLNYAVTTPAGKHKNPLCFAFWLSKTFSPSKVCSLLFLCQCTGWTGAGSSYHMGHRFLCSLVTTLHDLYTHLCWNLFWVRGQFLFSEQVSTSDTYIASPPTPVQSPQCQCSTANPHPSLKALLKQLADVLAILGGIL